MTAATSEPMAALTNVSVSMVPYDPVAHRDFVMGSFCTMVLTTWPWSAMPLQRLEDRFVRELRSPDSVVRVASLTVDPDTLCGWMVAKPHANDIVAGYVRRPLRRKWGIGTGLARACGISRSLPIGVWFWTYACERMFRAHPDLRLFHRVTD